MEYFIYLDGIQFHCARDNEAAILSLIKGNLACLETIRVFTEPHPEFRTNP